MRARTLPAAVSIGLVALALVGPAGAAGTGVRVVRDGEAARFRVVPADRTVQADTTVEPSAAVNSADPRHLVVAYQAGRSNGAAAVGYAVTFDAGRHWSSGLLPRLTTLTGGEFERASDPVVAFGPGNTVYVSTLAFLGTTSAILNHTSHDGGRHWDAPTTVYSSPDTFFHDKNWVVVDNGTGPGHHTGRVYVAWGADVFLGMDPVYDEHEPVVVSYSDDEGRTWLRVPSVANSGPGMGVVPLVLPNGDLAVVYLAYAGLYAPVSPPDVETTAGLYGRLAIAVARGAGLVPTGAPLAFGPETQIAAYHAMAVPGLRAPGLPTADVDQATGRIYVAWKDGRHRADEGNDVVVTSSTDGLRWAEPTRVNGGRPDDRVNHFTPALAVAADGSVRVAYRQRQDGPPGRTPNPYVDTYLQTSGNHGETWSAPLRVNRTSTDLRFAAYSQDSAFLGDYMQVVAAGAYTYVVRCEALRTSPRDRGSLPPQYDHHQRTWVALVGPRTGPLS